MDNTNLDGSRCVLTIGNFDGVHVGHQRILATARKKATERKVPLAVLTFEPHPLAILHPNHPPERISTPERKLKLLEKYDADVAVVAQSCPSLLQIEAETFIETVIVARFRPTAIVEGHNFGFGKGRRGNGETLQEFASRWDYEVEIVEPVMQVQDDGAEVRVSSSLVRKLLNQGNAQAATKALGRPFELTGTVVEGSKRGREIGFPTANLLIEHQLVPAEGVYAGSTEVDGEHRACAISIGTTPTFDGQTRQVEAHLLDFSGDLYGRVLHLRFNRRVREQIKFDSIEALISQIQTDVNKIRNMQL
ncbi:MAG: bifunctional riboflavin kinase/FAD synthetase [Planctomycetes bacterium]|nr:bifunctional riboflavin kinase/FAD synthetase [Planctomycetota bacterium]